MAPWREKPTLEQDFWQDLRAHGDPMLELLVKDCIPWERPHVGGEPFP